MNTENKVFNKLFSSEKIELESQKFEFALTDDYSKLLAEAKDLKNKSNANMDNVMRAKNDLLAMIKKGYEFDKKSLELQNKGDALLNQLKNSAKELGIDYKKTDAWQTNESVLKELIMVVLPFQIKGVIETVLKA